MLSPDEIACFVADGFVAVRGAIPPDVIAACQDGIWAELAGYGPRRDDPATWTEPVIRIVTPDSPPFVAAGGTRLVGEACDQLLGPGRW
ncbi:MAG TPA: phytanoyl-CoA dioxygenase, partial [Streptosporangiaceae bacterium]